MTTKKQIDDFVKERNDSLANEQKEKGEFFYKHFVENKPLKTIPESLFVQYILPFFNPNYVMNEETYSTFLINWIGLAGAPTMELGVTDAQGNILFLCPAMFDTEIINAKRDLANSKNVSNFFKAYLAQHNVASFSANIFFNSNVYQIYKELVKDNPRLDENRKRWENIFVRYGLMTRDGIPLSNSNSRNQESDDVFD